MSKLLVDEIGGNAGVDTTIASGKKVAGTASQFKMTDVVQGDVLYGSAADTLSRLPKGAAAQVLSMNSGATAPEWAATAAGGGKILQVIQSTKKDTDSTTSSGTTFVDIAGTDQDAAGSVWCVKITPAATSSKILCTYTATCGTSGSATVQLRLVRDSTDVFLADAAGSRVTTSSIAGVPHNDAMQSSSMTYLDSPSSTSELTYKVQWAAISGHTVYCNRSLSDTDSASYQRSASTITVVEIGA